MKKYSNSLGLVGLMALAGLVGTNFVAGCGGDDAITVNSSGGGSGVGTCGDGVVKGDEVCDDGNMVSGDGCEADCTFSCDNANPDTGNAKCDDGDPCNGVETCSDNHACIADKSLDDGASCGMKKICITGACVDEVCGDGFLASSEECDDGNATDGDGCEISCKFSCVSDDATRDCSGLDPCVATSCNDATHTCDNPVGEGQVCGIASVCISGACSAIVCGDGVMQPGEECDDGNTTNNDGCQGDCTLAQAGAICGNGTREAGEHCDDGNTTNLDGCDFACKLEQVQRANWLQIQYAAGDSDCPANALGGAISPAAQDQIQGSLTTGVENGSINILFKTLGLNDLTGMSDPSVEVGIMAGSPIIPAGSTYSGTADLDWWYKIAAQSIDANRNPNEKLLGYITGGMLKAGPGELSLGISFVGTPVTLKMTDARLMASIGASTTPLSSTGATPGHLASENLDPMLKTFASTAQPTDLGAGKLCGNVAAASLDAVPLPADLAQGGQLACDQNYSNQASLLDVFVSGCTVFGFVQVIKATQPDQVDPNAPIAGVGGPYTLTVNAQKLVTGCQDANKQSADLATCLNAAAYSSFFKFATGRVIAK